MHLIVYKKKNYFQNVSLSKTNYTEKIMSCNTQKTHEFNALGVTFRTCLFIELLLQRPQN